MSPLSRRDLLKAGIVAGAVAGVGSLNLTADQNGATSWSPSDAPI